MNRQVIRNGHLVVKIDRDLNLWSVPEIRKRILKVARSRKNIHTLGIDLTDVKSLDTAGLALLVEIYRLLRRRGGRFYLVGFGNHIEKMIRLAGLEGLLRKLDS